MQDKVFVSFNTEYNMGLVDINISGQLF